MFCLCVPSGCWWIEHSITSCSHVTECVMNVAVIEWTEARWTRTEWIWWWAGERVGASTWNWRASVTAQQHAGMSTAMRVVAVTIVMLINIKKCQLIHNFNSHRSKTAKIIKIWFYSPSHLLNINVVLSNNNFWWFFAVFDPSLLTL